jgi:fatty-acyl-CoA synthase
MPEIDNNNGRQLIQQASNTSIGGLFTQVVKQNPNSIAIISGTQEVSFHELNLRVNILANELINKGIKLGDRVALISKNCAECIELELACAKIGGILVSLNWRLTPPEIEHCIDLTNPKIIFGSEDFVLTLNQKTKVEYVSFGPQYEKLFINTVPSVIPLIVDSEAGLVIIFTSGTTGLPKGALLSHRALIFRALIFASETNAPINDTFVAWTPLYHMGSNDFSIATLLRGGKVIIIDGYNPDQMIDAIEKYSIHYFTVVPGMIEDFISKLKKRNTKPKPIGLIGAMADLVPKPLLEEITKLLNAPYFNTFGSTETGNPPASGNLVPIGKIPNVLSKKQNHFCEIRLVNSEGKDVKKGEPGELAIRGPSLFSGYWANSEANAEAFRDGWFHMGDVFKQTSDGLLDFVDRVKYMIKSGAENIYPAEIEKHLFSDPRILDAAVVRKSDEKWGEVPVVFVASTNKISSEQVINICKGKIANYKLPKEVYMIDINAFPRSTSGKIQRHILEARLEALG